MKVNGLKNFDLFVNLREQTVWYLLDIKDFIS